MASGLILHFFKPGLHFLWDWTSYMINLHVRSMSYVVLTQTELEHQRNSLYDDREAGKVRFTNLKFQHVRTSDLKH